MKIDVEKLKSRSYEVSNSKTFVDITYILATADIPNGNGALFTAQELETAKETIINQPLIMVGSEPTGHDLINFPNLTNGKAIGTHIDSWMGSDKDGIKHLYAKARVWKIRFNEIAMKLIELHEQDNLKFSMECSYEKSSEIGSSRKLEGVEFIGSAAVDIPANEWSRSVSVANKKKGELGMDLEEAKKEIERLREKVKQLQEDLSACQSGKKDSDDNKEEQATLIKKLEKEKDTLTASLKSSNETIDELNSEISQLKKKEKKREIASKGESRFNEISEFLDFKEDEAEAKKEEYGQMSNEVWNIVLETAKRNPKTQKKVSVASDVSIDLENNFLEGLGE